MGLTRTRTISTATGVGVRPTGGMRMQPTGGMGM